jgi:hypothetical protein
MSTMRAAVFDFATTSSGIACIITMLMCVISS